MTVSYGDNATADDSNKGCLIQTTLSYPVGWAFAMVWTSFYGYEQAASATRQSWRVVYTLNNDTNVTSSAGFVGCTGHYDGERGGERYDGTGSILLRDGSSFDAKDMPYLWSACGTNSTRINTNYEIKAAAWVPTRHCYRRRKRGIVAGNSSVELQLIWKKCWLSSKETGVDVDA